MIPWIINGFNIAGGLLRIVSISRHNLLCFKKLYNKKAFSRVGLSGNSAAFSYSLNQNAFM